MRRTAPLRNRGRTEAKRADAYSVAARPRREEHSATMTRTDVDTLGFDAELLARLIALVRDRTRVDLGAYRDGTVRRRVRNRMAHLAIDEPHVYVAHLESDPHEASRLLDHVLVKVSRFYRSAPAFDHVRTELLPALAPVAAGRPLKILSVGSGRGEEAWTFAMLLEEAGLPGVVVAADVDAGALFATARATYPESALVELPADLRERFLERSERAGETAWRVRTELRSRVRVELRDVLRPPAGVRAEFDLVSCRNLLIYLSAAAQVEVVRSLCALLRPGRTLLLGEAEWPARELLGCLRPVAPRHRLFAVPEELPAIVERTA